MLFRDILLIKKELHKFYDVNRADGPFVVAGKLFKSLEGPGEMQRDEDSKYRATDDVRGGNNNGDEFLKIIKAKDAELKAKDEKLQSVMEENARLQKMLESSKGEMLPPPPLEGRASRTSTVDQLRSGIMGGIDLKKESYLSDEEFREVFGMGKVEFEGLTGWKKVEMKKSAGLF
ncbi:hypothetical protein TrVE_jg11291 [Triparma verrucosa]|uniref:HP domain-containing protein n=1 Tax=Triparma verrucosa TaxID=1606542 RepID=A0A9W7FK89_9STRA|nr:hypothetical protein TrVE_jg11291 [Triparma verrucosa]